MSMLFPQVWNEGYDPFVHIVEDDTDEEDKEIKEPEEDT